MMFGLMPQYAAANMRTSKDDSGETSPFIFLAIQRNKNFILLFIYAPSVKILTHIILHIFYRSIKIELKIEEKQHGYINAWRLHISE
jgi:hypothetical protein